MTTFRFNEHNYSINDDRIAALISNSDRRPLTPRQEALCDHWIAKRSAIMRRAVRHALRKYVDGTPEYCAARDQYLAKRGMDCAPGYNRHEPTAEERARAKRLRREGKTFTEIAKRMGFSRSTITRLVVA